MRVMDAGVIGAPAISSRPSQRVNVFLPTAEGNWARIPKSDAVKRHRENPNFERVSAIGTGVMLIDVDVFRTVPQPWFEDVYEPTDVDRVNVHQSQDTSFCRKCNQAGISVYCNWYSWAGHWKLGCEGEPELPAPIPPEGTLTG
jgi:hypothetical protein